MQMTIRLFTLVWAVALTASPGDASLKPQANPQSVRPADVQMGNLLLRTDVGRGYVPAPAVDTRVRIRIEQPR